MVGWERRENGQREKDRERSVQNSEHLAIGKPEGPALTNNQISKHLIVYQKARRKSDSSQNVIGFNERISQATVVELVMEI